MGHMATVLARQFHQGSFDKRADIGDLPQDRLAPRHEPIFRALYGLHGWTVLIHARIGNKKSACDNFLVPQALFLHRQALFRRLFSLTARAFRCDESVF